MSKFFIFFFIFHFSMLFAQEKASLVSDDFKRIDFTFENDFVNETDYYYSNGIQLAYSSYNFANSFLFALFSSAKKKQYDRYGIGIEHKFYTPIDKNNIENLGGDRPFASYFLINLHKETRKEFSKSSNYFQVGIGLLGDYTGGEEIQNYIHKILPGNEAVLGWDSQIKTEFLFDIQYIYEKGLFHSKNLDIMVFGKVQAGTLRDNLGLGTHFRLGWMPDYYNQNIGNSHRLGNGIYIFSEIILNSRWIAYDATLVGGVLHREDNVYVVLPTEIENFVHQANISLNIRYKKYKLSFIQTFLSPEIKNGLSHKYGGIKLIFDF